MGFALVSRRAVLGGAAAAAFSTRAGAQTERVLRFIPDNALVTLDPLSTDETTRMHGFMVWDTLFGIDAQGSPHPQMCASHTVSPDGRTWRLVLRENLTFHDGDAVGSVDCIASIARWMKRNPYGVRLQRVLDSLVQVDERTFEIRSSKPFPRLLHALGTPVPPVCFIMPERIATEGPDTPIKEIVGSGPYVFLAGEFQPGARASYARFDKYVPRQEPPNLTAGGKIARFDRIEWLGVGDPALAVAALRDGLADWWQTALQDMVPVLRASRGVQLQQLDPFGRVAVLRLNAETGPFSDSALRRALLPDIDQGVFMNAATGGDLSRVRTDAGVFAPDSPLANKDGLVALAGPRDPAMAAHLVQASGHAGNGVTLIGNADSPEGEILSGIARMMLERIGLQVEDEPLGVQDFAARLASGKWNAACTSGEALAFYDPISHDAITGKPTTALAALHDEWFSAGSDDEARQQAAAIQQAVLHDVPYIPLGLWYPLTASAGLTDFVHAPFPVFWSVRGS